MGRAHTGDGDEYDHADEDAAEAACDEAWAAWEDEQADARASGGGGDGGTGGAGAGGWGLGADRAGSDRAARLPNAMRVRADVEWSGENRGPRAVNLDGLNLAEFQRATARSRAAAAKASAARPAASYNASGWRAQLRQLEATQRGRDALNRSGFDAAPRTRRRWRAGTGQASKSRQEQIANAYQDARMFGVRAANKARQEANRDLLDTLTETIADAYGGTRVRLHNITEMELRRR